MQRRLDPLALPASAGTCCGQEKALAPGLPCPPGSSWALSALQPRVCPRAPTRALRPPSEAPSEHAREARAAPVHSRAPPPQGIPQLSRVEVSTWAATGPPSPRRGGRGKLLKSLFSIQEWKANGPSFPVLCSLLNSLQPKEASPGTELQTRDRLRNFQHAFTCGASDSSWVWRRGEDRKDILCHPTAARTTEGTRIHNDLQKQVTKKKETSKHPNTAQWSGLQPTMVASQLDKARDATLRRCLFRRWRRERKRKFKDVFPLRPGLRPQGHPPPPAMRSALVSPAPGPGELLDLRGYLQGQMRSLRDKKDILQSPVN